jgi:hypothetical protein
VLQSHLAEEEEQEDWLMLLSPGSAEKVSKIRVKNREPVPSYRMDRNDDEIDAMMVSHTNNISIFIFLVSLRFYFILSRSVFDL